MRLRTLSLLRCVRRTEEAPPCGATLRLGTEPPARTTGEELLEGALVCEACGASYPVVAGVAVVVRNPFRYFRGFFPVAKGYLAEVGGMSRPFEVWLYAQMLGDLERKDEKLFPRPQPYDERVGHALHKWLGTYLLTHYFPPVPSGEPLLDGLLEASHRRGPLALLGDMATRWCLPGAGLGVDIGCSVGGLTLRLASLCEYAMGVDLSFEKVLTARRVVLRAPCGPAPLRLYHEGVSYESVPIPEVSAENLDFVVASGSDAPVESGSADIVSSCNLIDIVNDPLAVLAEHVRILSPRGLLVLSTPYLDHTAAVTQHLAADGRDPRETVFAHLPGFRILEEATRVPWLLRASDRHYDLYLDHCFAARRDGN